ncbi:E3 ubiquitin-protein ligase RFWD2 [Copidosoma floridanum]|uniref:E3 ubiquitin-protein ligase RFWD2 n=1 Tax=Copidosoma floridanum TaxID=29053 RepID=UPI0006C94AFD|nr:E3 ubiquitin-protein ligase RFWD2 [Copidosoma floridanum]
MSTEGNEARPNAEPRHHRANRSQNQIIHLMQGVKNTLEDINNDFLCSICFEIIEEAHITRCGHTFCYRCICKSIETLKKCPKCNTNLTRQEILPNFLVNELIAKSTPHPRSNDNYRAITGKKNADSSADITNTFRTFVSSDSTNLSLQDVNVMLEMLTYRKKLLEAQEHTANNKLLYEFLRHLLKQKEEQKKHLEKEIDLIRQDLSIVESTLKTLQSDSSFFADCSGNSIDAGEPSAVTPDNDSLIGERKKRMYVHFDDFAKCYFDARAKELHFGNPELESSTKSSSANLDVFRVDLIKFSRYNSLRPLATLNYSANILNDSNIVSSIEFDKDNEFFAIAGVTKKIQVFDYNTVIHDSVNVHFPSAEMSLNSKISCLSWNTFHKAILASSDYEGTVTIWNAMTGQKSRVFLEHEKRCWSIDFNEVDIRLLASGSDDAKVKLWSLTSEVSISSLEAHANVCCVKFNPQSSCHLAFGSADHCVYYYDLRNTSEPLRIFKGHKKSVSYLKFLNDHEIVSASTDSQLKMWNVNDPYCLRSFDDHVNEKNFVGLATDGDYIACGSENNSVYVYYKGLSKQLMFYKFEAPRSILGTEDRVDEDLNEFISAVCWRKNSNVVVAANSQGVIKILELT